MDWLAHSVVAALSVLIFCVSYQAHAGGTGEYYEYQMPWNSSAAALIHASTAPQPGPAGRRWGAGVRFTDRFPPRSDHELGMLFDAMEAYGFNHVRVWGFDFEQMGMFRDEKRFRTGMHRLCHFLSLARERGFNYAVDLNHNAGRYDGKYDDPASPRQHLREKVTQLLDPEMVLASREWMQRVLTYTSDECPEPLATDPALVHMALVNEDSLYRALIPGSVPPGSGSHRLMPWSETVRGELKGKALTIRNFLGLSDLAAAEAMGVLADAERRVFSELEQAVRETGFKGELSTTNQWYGVHQLAAVHQIGNAVDVHLYFDRPRRMEGDRYRFENWSYLGRRDHLNRGIWNYSVNPLHLLFSAALPDRSMHISEWNHSGWSDFAYEGPVLLTAYGSLQGVVSFAIHSLQETASEFGQDQDNAGLSFFGNHVLKALSPGLSLAFRREDIRVADAEVPVSVPVCLTRMGVDRWRHKLVSATLHPFQPLVGHYRVAPVITECDAERALESTPEMPRTVQSATGQVQWTSQNDGTGVLVIGTDRFNASVGDHQLVLSADVPVSPAVLDAARVETRSAVTAISLDHQPVIRSRRILVTHVGPAHYPPKMEPRQARTLRGERIIHAPRPIKAQGFSRLRGSISLTLADIGVDPEISCLAEDGTTYPWPAVVEHSVRAESVRLSYKLDGLSSPWCFVSRPDKSEYAPGPV